MKIDPTRCHGRPLSHPENDVRTPAEIAWWNENITAQAHKRPPLPLAEPKRKYGKHPPEIPIPHIKLADAWTFDAVQFLKELAYVREMILSIPALPAETPDQATAKEYYTLGTRSRGTFWIFGLGFAFFSIAMVCAVVATCTNQVQRGLILLLSSFASLAICAVIFFVAIFGAMFSAVGLAAQKARQQQIHFASPTP